MHEDLLPFWKACADLNLYVFIHPLARVISWDQMYADDLGRMLGWQFSLMMAGVRLINSGVLDKLPTLNVQFAHFAGGIGRYLGRVRGFQQRDKWGTSKLKGHNRQPPKSFDYYLEQRLFYDVAGWAGPDHAGPWGAEWVHFGMRELALPQIVFATDYPQAVRVDEEVVDYVERRAGARAERTRHAGRAECREAHSRRARTIGETEDEEEMMAAVWAATWPHTVIW